MRNALLGLLFALSLIGPSNAQSLDDGDMQPLVSRTMRLAAALDAIAYERSLQSLADDASEDDIRAMVRGVDPSLLYGFEGTTVKLGLNGIESSVLVCDGPAKRALIEDAGCSAQPDWQPWRDAVPKACAFGLALSNICGH